MGSWAKPVLVKLAVPDREYSLFRVYIAYGQIERFRYTESETVQHPVSKRRMRWRCGLVVRGSQRFVLLKKPASSFSVKR